MKLSKLAIAALLLAGIGTTAKAAAPIAQPTAGPLAMSTFVGTYLNPTLEGMAGCWEGASAPANGPGAAPVLYECWVNTAASPASYELWDGGAWDTLGTINATSHLFTPSIPSGINITGSLTGHASLDLAIANNLSDVASAATARTNLGLGTAATQNTGTSGATVGLLNGSNTTSGTNTHSGAENFTGTVELGGAALGTGVSSALVTPIDGSGGLLAYNYLGTGVGAALANPVNATNGMLTYAFLGDANTWSATQTFSLAAFGTNTDAAGGINRLNFFEGAYGIGISPGSIDYVTASSESHSFYVGATKVASINGTGFTATGLTDTGLTAAGIVTNTAAGGLGTEPAITPSQCPTATTSAGGCVEPDGTTITVTGGKISAVTGGTGNVVGTGTSVVGDIAELSNTTTTGITDSGIPYNAIPAANSTFTAPGTGGVGTTLQARSDLTLYAADYGADCTAASDSSSALQYAVNQAEAADVALHLCSMKIGTSITVTNSLTAFGDGFNLTTIYTNAATLVLFNVTTVNPVIFHDFMVTPSSGVTPSAGEAIALDPSANQNDGTQVYDIECSQEWNCIYTTRAALWSVHNNIFLGCINVCLTVSNSNNPDSGDSEVADNLFVGADALGPAGGCLTTGTDIYQTGSGGLRIKGNKFNCAAIAYELNLTGTTSDLLITGNSFENCARTACIYLTTTSGSYQFYNVSIVGNEIASYVTSVEGIYISGASGWLGNVSIAGNTGSVGGTSANTWAEIDYASGLALSGNVAAGSSGSNMFVVGAGVSNCNQSANAAVTITKIEGPGTCTND